jgi:hypothetical protein
MGSFIVNVNIRSEDRSEVEQVVRALKCQEAWVTGSRNGWITVYESRASSQDGDWIRRLSEQLSNALKASVIAFLVHDSDVLAYWLCAEGQLIDEYNSFPDCFEEVDEPTGPSGGDADLLLPYCIDGTQREQVEEILHEGAEIFAEQHLIKVAELLGIDSERVINDFRSVGTEVDPAELDASFVGTRKRPSRGSSQRRLSLFQPDPDTDEAPDASAFSPEVGTAEVPQLLQALGLSPNPADIDPQVRRLVQAAADNNVAEIDHLAAAGANLNGLAPGKPSTGSIPFTTQMLTGGRTPFPITPLVMAVAHQHPEAVRRLIELGADPNAGHPIFGTAVHAAAITGDVELLRLVLDAGGDVHVQNGQQQTPLQALQVFRQLTSQMGQLGSLDKVLGGNRKGQWDKAMPAAEGLAACERLLRERSTST